MLMCRHDDPQAVKHHCTSDRSCSCDLITCLKDLPPPTGVAAYLVVVAVLLIVPVCLVVAASRHGAKGRTTQHNANNMVTDQKRVSSDVGVKSQQPIQRV
jgi:hypothetical protein